MRAQCVPSPSSLVLPTFHRSIGALANDDGNRGRHCYDSREYHSRTLCDMCIKKYGNRGSEKYSESHA